MPPNGNFHAQKRFGDDDGLDTSLLKRFKLERTKEPVNLETSDEGLQVPTKSCTRGVERIVPYPSNCRPNTENYGWNRRQLVLNVKRLLAVKGKRVYGVPRFLDDGVTFDWVLDNSAMAMLRDEESEEFTTSPSAIEETVKPAEKVNPNSINSIKVEPTISKDEDFIMRIPGLELYNSGVMPLPHYSSGTVENPIQILGSDGLEPPQRFDNLLGKKDAPVSEWCENSAARDENGVCRANSLFKAVPTTSDPDTISMRVDDPNRAIVDFPTSEVIRQNPAPLFAEHCSSQQSVPPLSPIKSNGNSHHFSLPIMSPVPDFNSVELVDVYSFPENAVSIVQPKGTLTPTQRPYSGEGEHKKLDSPSRHLSSFKVNGDRPRLHSDPSYIDSGGTHISSEDFPCTKVKREFKTPPTEYSQFGMDERRVSRSSASLKNRENLRASLPVMPVSAAALPDSRHASGGHRSLKNVDWANHKTILFIKGLGRCSTLEDVYEYLKKNGYPFARVKDIQLHCEDLPKPMASVQFFNQQETQDALHTLQTSNISFPVPSEGTSSRRERVNVRIEPCQPPKWYQTDSSTAPAAAAFTGTSLSTRVSGTQSPSAPPPSHVHPSSAIEDPPSADRPASTSKRILTASGASCSRIRQESSSETSSSDTGASSSENEDVVPRERVALSRQPRKAAALRRSSTPAEIQDDIVMANSQVNSNGVIDISSDSGRDDDDDGSDTTSSSEDEDNESDSSSERSVGSKHNRRQPRIRAGVGDGEPSRAQSVLVTGKTRQSVRIRIPKVKHGRPRRLLLPPDLASPLMTVTMRGDMQFIDQRARKRLTKLSLPAVDEEAKRVEDACLVGRTAIIGYSRGDSQASMVTYAAESNERAAVIPLSKAPHSGWGISCLAPMSFSAISEDPDDKDAAISFLSGGFDKTVMQWRVTRGIKEDKGEGRNNRHRPYNATVHPLGGPLNSGVSSVVYHASSQRVLSAAGKKLWTIDIEGRVPPRSVEFNNLIHQIHVHRNSPDIVILEVQHLYTQMQVYDVRKNNRGKPEMEFGYMDTAASVGRIRARRRRGDTSVNYFTRGFDDGTVCLWDYRNRGITTVAATKLDEPVWHTVFAGRKSSNVWAYAGNSVTFLEIDPPKH